MQKDITEPGGTILLLCPLKVKACRRSQMQCARIFWTDRIQTPFPSPLERWAYSKWPFSCLPTTLKLGPPTLNYANHEWQICFLFIEPLSFAISLINNESGAALLSMMAHTWPTNFQVQGRHHCHASPPRKRE